MGTLGKPTIRVNAKTDIILVFFFGSNLLFEQEHIIQGIVHTLDKILLMGAKIKVQSSQYSLIPWGILLFSVKRKINSIDHLI